MTHDSAANRASFSRQAGEPTLSGYNTRSQKKKARDESSENYEEPAQQPEGMKTTVTTRSRAHIQQQLEAQGASGKERDHPKAEEEPERRAVALWMPVSSFVAPLPYVCARVVYVCVRSSSAFPYPPLVLLGDSHR